MNIHPYQAGVRGDRTFQVLPGKCIVSSFGKDALLCPCLEMAEPVMLVWKMLIVASAL